MTRPHKKNARKSRKKRYDSLFLGIGIGTVIVFSILAVAFVILLSRNIPEEETASPGEPPVQEEAKEPEVPEAPRTPEEETAADYPMPEYNFMLEEVYIPIEGLSKEYTLAWVSDLHLIPEEDSNISPSPRLKTRYEELSVTDEGIHAEDLWPEVVKCLNYGNYDAVIFGGDMMDYCSEDNMKLFREGYDALRYEKDQILYIRADHDYGAWYVGDNFTQRDIYDLHEALDGDDPEKKYLDMGEFILIGINNSTKNITEENFSIVEKQYENAAAENKPVIAVTHVPYGSNVDESLKELSMKVRNKPYYWVGPDYQPNDTMWDYLDFIFREDTQVKQVLAGHLHAPWDGQITEQLREHIFSPAFDGVIGVIHIIPAGPDAEAKTESHRLRSDGDIPENEGDTDGDKAEDHSDASKAVSSQNKDPAGSQPVQTPAVPSAPVPEQTVPQTPSVTPPAGTETPVPPTAGENNDASADPGTPPATDTQAVPDALPPAADTQTDPGAQQTPADAQVPDGA